MTAPWFYIANLPRIEGELRLDAREARHATGSKRLGVGDEITLFDGSGELARAELIEVSRESTRVRVTERWTAPEPQRTVHIAAAIPKGSRGADMISMITQLGVTTFTALECARSVVSRIPVERWQRVASEACKQCRRPRFLEIAEPLTPLEFVRQRSEETTTVFGHVRAPGDEDYGYSWRTAANPIGILIGPEGGFDPDEISQLIASGAKPANLGEYILRIETAVVTAASLALLEAPTDHD